MHTKNIKYDHFFTFLIIFRKLATCHPSKEAMTWTYSFWFISTHSVILFDSTWVKRNQIWHLQAVLEVNVSIFVDVPPELQRHEMDCLFQNLSKGDKIKLIFAENATQPPLFPFCLEFSVRSFRSFCTLIFLRLEATYPTHNTHGDSVPQSMESSPNIH